MSYDSTVLADSPDGCWPLDDANGSGSVRDASGNGHAGTPTNVTLGSTGYANDGSNRRVTYYLDGVLNTQTTGSTSTSLNCVNPFRLGDINSGGAGNYNGTLQKFALWKSALTATQI